MSEASADVQRAFDATKAIFDGRDPEADFGAVMVTLEHVVAVVLIALHRSPDVAARMLNEGLLEGVEGRLALFAKRSFRPGTEGK